MLMTAFAEKHYPEILLPEELDAYLDRGWYRMGQTIFTTHFLCFNEQFYSAIWVRLPLEGFRFRKGQRKLMRKNGERFTIQILPASLNREKELLYQRYKAYFPGTLAPSLRESLLDGEDYNVFNTLEIQILDGEKLVGLSFFDIGKESAASIMGIYDPDYQSFSLGYYSMLLEMTFCQQQQIRFYYPGYVVPGYQRFDYKLRIGEVDYLDLQSLQWKPYAELSPEQIPIQQMRHRLEELKNHLAKTGISSAVLHYPLFEANLFGFWNAPYLDYPVVLELKPESATNGIFHLVVFDIRELRYHWLRCTPFDDLQFYFNEAYTDAFQATKFFMELTIIEQVIARSETPEEMSYLIEREMSQMM